MDTITPGIRFDDLARLYHRFNRWRSGLLVSRSPSPDFRILVSDLRGDRDSAQTRLLAEGLISVGNLDVRLLGRSLTPSDIGDVRENLYRVVNKAEAILKDHNADLLILGSVDEQRIYVSFIPGWTGTYLPYARLDPTSPLPEPLLEVLVSLVASVMEQKVASYESGLRWDPDRLKLLSEKLRALSDSPLFGLNSKIQLLRLYARAALALGIRTGDTTVVQQAVSALEQELSVRSNTAEWTDRFAFEEILARALHVSGELSAKSEMIERSISLYRKILEYPHIDKVREGMIRTGLGFALKALFDLTGNIQLLHESEKECREAVSLLETQDRHAWAEALNYFGLTLTFRGLVTRDPQSLDEAIRVFELALTVRTQSEFPLWWAITNTNRNLALAAPDQVGFDVIRRKRAVAEQKRVLASLNPKYTPREWARGQSILGFALLDLARATLQERYARAAVRAHRAALEIYLARSERDWASMQNNLGEALQFLGQSRNDTALLEEALTRFEAAVGVFSRAGVKEVADVIHERAQQVKNIRSRIL